MSRLLVVAMIVALAFAVSTTAVANDYLVGGMFNTPHVTHYRTAQTGQVSYYAPTACQPACQPACRPQPCARPVYAQPGCQTAFYPQAVAAPQMAVAAYRPVTVAAVPQPVVAARPVVVRSKYYVVGQPLRNVGRWLLPGVPSVVAAPQPVAVPAAF
jgi:hypothetical protein